MKNKFLLFLTICAMFFATNVFATVGSHKIFTNFGYDNENKTIIAVKQVYESSDLLECEIPNISGPITDCNVIKQQEGIREEFKKINPVMLQSIDLKKNKFILGIKNIIYPEIDSKTSDNQDQYNPWLVIWKKINLDFSLSQNNIEKIRSSIEACSWKGNAVGANGFIIPGTSQAIIVLRDLIDCEEIGYFEDFLFFIKDITIYDQSFISENTFEDKWIIDVDRPEEMNIFTSYSTQVINDKISNFITLAYDHAISLSKDGQYQEALDLFRGIENTTLYMGLVMPDYGQNEYDKSKLIIGQSLEGNNLQIPIIQHPSAIVNQEANFNIWKIAAYIIAIFLVSLLIFLLYKFLFLKIKNKKNGKKSNI